MNSKKAITLLVLATMIMALVPIVPAQAAITPQNIYKDDVVVAAPVYYEDELMVNGTGVTSGATVDLFWDIVQPWDASTAQGKIASAKAKASGAFELEFEVPEALNGDHYLWLKDVSTGETVMIDDPLVVGAKLVASPKSGLDGDTIDLTGYGYDYDEDNSTYNQVEVTFPDGLATDSSTHPKANALGTFTYSFKITAEDYDNYTITGEQVGDPTITATKDDFKVGASITMDKSEGPSGTVVTISGRGFNNSLPVTVEIDGTACYIVSGDETRSDGRITSKIVIPSMPLVDDEPTEYGIVLTDDDGIDATADFEVNGIAEVKASPAYGPQGTVITVEGWNFTQTSGTEVEVTLAGAGAKTFKTDSSGYFTGSYQIPAVSSGEQDLNATTDDHGVNASSTVRVGVMLVIVTPEADVSGALVSMTGVGFTEEGEVTVYLDDDEWFTGDAENDGTFSFNENVPTMDPGVYTIKVVDEDTEIDVETEFEVTETTKLTLTPEQAPNEYNVTVEGWYFAELEDAATDGGLEFILYNSTQEWTLNVEYGGDPVELKYDDDDWDDGYFKGFFEVDDNETISIGTYTLNVTDSQGMRAQTTLDVVEKTQAITPRKSVFQIGDTVSFNIETSFAIDEDGGGYIEVYDPSGELYWETDAFDEDVWVTVGTVNRVPYYYQTAGGNPMVLLADAPLGTYTWEFFDGADDSLDTGTFTVEEAAADVVGDQVADLSNQVTELAGQLDNVQTEFDEVKGDISDVSAIAQQAVDAANQASEAVQTVAETANQANTAAENAQTAAEQARDAANSLTTLVYGAIGAALVAALAAIVSLMQISRRIAG
jgi:hypothetical protein